MPEIVSIELPDGLTLGGEKKNLVLFPCTSEESDPDKLKNLQEVFTQWWNSTPWGVKIKNHLAHYRTLNWGSKTCTGDVWQYF